MKNGHDQIVSDSTRPLIGMTCKSFSNIEELKCPLDESY